VKLQRVAIRGLKSVASDTLELDAVTLLVGPNGAGKTAVVGAIVYALTGRFPGVVGVDVATLLTLAADPRQGFMVTLTADKIIVERGVVSGKSHMRVICDGRATEGSKKCDAILAREFGDVQFAADAFDPERSVWRLSPEKRKAWASDLCRGASSWTIARLIQEIGPKSDDWNPDVTHDPATVVDIHVGRLSAVVLQSQKTSREAGVVADNVAQPDPPTPETMAEAEKAYDDARLAIQALRLRDLRSADGSSLRLERAKLVELQRAAYATLVSLGEPAPEHETEIEDADGAAMAAEMALDEAAQVHGRVSSGLRALECAHADDIARLDHVAKTNQCPTCGSDGAAATLRLGRRLAARSAELEALSATVKVAHAACVTAGAGQVSARDRLAALTLEHDARKRAAADRITAEKFLGAAPEAATEDPPTAADLVIAQTTERVARERLHELRKSFSMAGERAAQQQAQTKAAKRSDELKTLLAKVRSVRDKMLADGIVPLRDALAKANGLAPGGQAFDARIVGDELVFGLVTASTGQLVPIETMSAGERYRATVALLMARAIVRREPWVGLLLDAFEAVYPPDERNRVLRVLSHFAATGVVDNVIAAGAFDPGSIEPVNNMMVHVRFRSQT